MTMDLEKLKNLYTDKRKFYPLMAVVSVAGFLVLAVATGSVTRGMDTRVAAKKQEYSVFEMIKAEYLAEKAAFEPLEKKVLKPPSASAGEMIEEIGLRTISKEKMASFKPLEPERKNGYTLSGVEVTFDNITLNELVNILYRIETHRNLLLVKDLLTKERFDDPSRLSAVIKVVLVKKQ